MKIDLTGKTALVTGAATGIGRGIAEVLADAGALVLVNDLDGEGAHRVATNIVQMGARAVPLVSDIAVEEQVRTVLAPGVRAHCDRLDILVNNAGIALFKGVEATEPEEWDRIMSVDVRAIYSLCRTLLPLLRKSESASVVNIASVHARATVAGMTAYAAAKGAVVAMVRAMAQEFGPDRIRVNSISPGFVDTPLFQSWLDTEPDPAASLDRVMRTIPIGRIATPREVGALVAFVSSEWGASISGADLVLDGGLTARLMH